MNDSDRKQEELGDGDCQRETEKKKRERENVRAGWRVKECKRGKREEKGEMRE